MLTFQDIYDAVRREKYSERLQKLQPGFVSAVSAYLREKGSIAAKRNGMFSDTVKKAAKQLKVARDLLAELTFRRNKKVIELALIAFKTGIGKNDKAAMLAHERDLFDGVYAKLCQAEESFKKSLENKAVKRKRPSQLLVRFETDVPEFLTQSGIKLGPFERNELANLPSEEARILLKANLASKA